MNLKTDGRHETAILVRMTVSGAALVPNLIALDFISLMMTNLLKSI